MQYKKFVIIIYLIIIYQAVFSQNNYESIKFNSPVDIPILLSGNFGEIRSTHFHAGIDIKTQGVIGKKIYSVEEGYISRIKISVNSYGKTLYINHPNGYTTVYGHLSGFAPKFDRYIKNIQYKNEEFEINYFPEPGELNVNKGELIAYSGNTGSSLGPHLHFEVRETKNQIPVNPLLFNFNIKDNLPPVLYNLVIYPLSNESYINDSSRKVFLPLKKLNGEYIINDTSEIRLSGKIGFGIEMYDYLNGSRNKCGIHTLSLIVDSSLIYKHQIDKFSFSEASFVKGHIDYAEKVNSKKTVQKMFIAPNNNLSIYKENIGRGIYEFNTDSAYQISLEVIDVYRNKSNLAFSVKGIKPYNDLIPALPQKGQIMHWENENSYIGEEISVQIPKNALFDTINFTYSKSEPEFKAYSSIHHIHNIKTPVIKPYSVTIKTKNLPQEYKEKAFIAEILDDEINSVGGTVLNGHISGETRSFGDFVVLIDTVSPEIKPLSDLNKPISKQIKFLVTDDLTGIKSFNGFIDNNWALFEYDKKNDLLFYIMDPDKIKSGTEHELELFVIDNMNNISTYYTTFHW